MRCHALAAQEYLDRPGGDPRLNLLAHEAVRHTVIVLGDLDMIIEVDATALPLRILIMFIRQRHQRWAIKLIKQLTPAASPAAQLTIIEVTEKSVDRFVE